MAEELRIVPAVPDRPLTTRDIAAVFFRHQKLFLIAFLSVMSVGLLYAILAPSYEAEMKILVRRGRIDPALTPTETAPPLLDKQEISEEELNSEVELLRDEDVLRKVVIETGLADNLSWFSRLRSRNREEQIARAVKRLARKIDVQPVRKSHLIRVAFKSSDARLSGAVLKSLANVYLARHAEVGRPSGQQMFFEQQMEQSRRTLEEAQLQLVEFTRRRKVVSAALERDLTLQKLSDAESANLGLQASIADAAERVRSLETKLLELPERRVTQIRSTDNPQLQEKLKSKLLELELKRTDLLTKFQPSYRLVQEVDQQISQAKAEIQAQESKPLRDELTEQNPEFEWASSEKIKALVDLQVLLKHQSVGRAQVAAYKQAAASFGENALMQAELERKLKAAEDKYLLYSNKREEARIGDALDQNGILNVMLAQEPRVPALPTWPIWAAACLAFAVAGVFSTGIVFATDYLDPSLRTPGEVLDLLGSSVLISLPARTENTDMQLA